jgi:hypothetical protein
MGHISFCSTLIILVSFTSLSALRQVRASSKIYSASPFRFQYLVFSFSSSSSCLYLSLLIFLHVPSTFPSTTCFRKQCLRKMSSLHLAFSFYCMQNVPFLLDSVQHFMFHPIVPTDLTHPSAVPHFKL